LIDGSPKQVLPQINVEHSLATTAAHFLFYICKTASNTFHGPDSEEHVGDRRISDLAKRSDGPEATRLINLQPSAHFLGNAPGLLKRTARAVSTSISANSSIS